MRRLKKGESCLCLKSGVPASRAGVPLLFPSMTHCRLLLQSERLGSALILCSFSSPGENRVSGLSDSPCSPITL